jgi:AcrR family transcriptional regulator
MNPCGGGRRMVPTGTQRTARYGTTWYQCNRFFVKQTKSKTGCDSDAAAANPTRERILGAAFKAFTESGYAETSTLEIATRAKVSKRELYALFGNKQAMLVACIAARVTRMRLPPDLPAARDRDTLARILATFGAILLREVCHPSVLAVFRLAVAEAMRSPEVAQVLDAEGRQANRAALSDVLAQAQTTGLLEAGDPTDMAGEFLALLWRDLMMGLMLRVTESPDAKEIERRALTATTAFLKLHPKP